jgi:hypothetical protein
MTIASYTSHAVRRGFRTPLVAASMLLLIFSNRSSYSRLPAPPDSAVMEVREFYMHIDRGDLPRAFRILDSSYRASLAGETWPGIFKDMRGIVISELTLKGVDTVQVGGSWTIRDTPTSDQHPSFFGTWRVRQDSLLGWRLSDPRIEYFGERTVSW